MRWPDKVKHQAATRARRKSQLPITKHQGSSNIQTSRSPQIRAHSSYLNTAIVTPLLQETPNSNAESKHPFDLEERTVRFGETVVRFCKKIPRDPTNDRLISQLAGCGTAIGANYCEADERVSKKDFRNTIGRCVKEAKETKFFLRMVAVAEPRLADEARELFSEARELHLIFASIYRKGIQ